jgi:hypothetical protein
MKVIMQETFENLMPLGPVQPELQEQLKIDSLPGGEF